MPDGPTPITVDGWLARMARLAVRQGVRLSSLQRKGGRDLELVLASATLHLPADTPLDEQQANLALQAFLVGSGAMLATDHVELRRWLVDSGYVRRSAGGTDYGRGALPDWLAPAATQLAAGQVEAAAAAARESHAQQRAASRQAWLANGSAARRGDAAHGR